MSAVVAIAGFWRVGRRAGPLHVLPDKQGSGGFDDPEHLVAVIYGAPSLRTCLLELLRPWPAGPEAAAILEKIPLPAEPEDVADAAADEHIAAASKRRAVPPFIFERDAIYAAALAGPLALLMLTDVTTLERLECDAGVGREMICCGYPQFDRGALLAPIAHRRLTQAVTNAVLRGAFSGERYDGMSADARHANSTLSFWGLVTPRRSMWCHPFGAPS